MRVLYLSNHKYDFAYASDYNNGGWIEALISGMRENREVEITVGYLSTNNNTLTIDNIKYVGIKKYGQSLNVKIANKIFGFRDNYRSRHYGKELGRFDLNKFDIIHVFGFECFALNALLDLGVRNKVFLHIQGLLPSISKHYCDMNIECSDFFRASLFHINRLKSSFNKEKKSNKERSKRVYDAFRGLKYFGGRTILDLSYFKVYSQGEYFRLEEILRNEFYLAQKWEYKTRKTLSLVSVISDVPYKGLRLICECMAILDSLGISFQWRIIGVHRNSRTARILNKEIANYSNKIVFLGRLDQKSIVNELLACSVMVHPSAIENSSNAVSEAMFLGVPIVAQYVGGLPSLLNEGKSGLLVPSDEPEIMVKSILDITKKELSLKASLSAKSTASERHNVDSIINNCLEIYKIIIDENRKINEELIVRSGAQ